jgi:hypothetical protein
MLRVTFRSVILFVLVSFIAVSVWLLKLNHSHTPLNLLADDKPAEDTAISSFESLVLVIFLDREVDKDSFEKVRAVIGVNHQRTYRRAFNDFGRGTTAAPFSI